MQNYHLEKMDGDLGLGTELLTVNMGPQHPSTHGVLRVILTLDGEKVVRVVPVLGYLHRAMEKIGENKTLNQMIPYTDRQDYLSPLSNNIALALAGEKICDVPITERCRVIRVICCELARISSHLLWLGTTALDTGAATVFFYTFNDREHLYNIIEKISGARFTTSYARIGGLARDWLPEVPDEIREFLSVFPDHLKEVDGLLTKNRIWTERTQDVGTLSKEQAIDMGLTGPPLRSTGVAYDVRRAYPYLGYERYDFDIPIGEHGDNFDRYMIRMEEMRQSCKIIAQALEELPDGPVSHPDAKHFLPPKERVHTHMEELIHQFMVTTMGPEIPAGQEIYSPIESPKGELGVYIQGNGSNFAHRLHWRSPCFVNLQALPLMSEGSLVADLVTTIASLDPVMGEVDR